MNHEIRVEKGLEFEGEVYIWCTCDVRPDTAMIGNQFTISPADKSVFRGKTAGELMAFLRRHSVPAVNGHKRTGSLEVFS